MELGLAGRSVIVAASSEGIGLAAALGFAAEGAHVAICSRDRAKLDRAADAVRIKAREARAHSAAEPEAEADHSVYAEVVDVTDASAVRAFVAATAERFGAVDICVTNAGGPPATMFLDTTPEGWQRAFELNLLSTVTFAHAVIPGMQARGWGRIVTVTSVAVRQPVDDLIYSNTIRAGVLGLVKSLSNQFGRDGITVNNVAPGYTLTDRMAGLLRRRSEAAGLSEEAVLEQLTAQVPLRRAARADEVADAIVWLGSERAAYITGQTLLVDGGIYKGL